MFKLYRYDVPNYNGVSGSNYIDLNNEENVVTSVPAEIFSYQVASGYAHSQDKSFNLTMVFTSDEAYSDTMEKILWLTESGKEGRLLGMMTKQDGTVKRMYMYCNCVGISAVDYDKNGKRRLVVSFYSREPFWIEESMIAIPSSKTNTTYVDIRVITRMNIDCGNLDKEYIHLQWKNLETGEDWHTASYKVTLPTSGYGHLFTSDHYRKIMQGSTFNINNASFNGYVAGEWFPTFLPAMKRNNQGSYAFRFINNTNADPYAGTTGNDGTAIITFLTMRGLPF